MPAGILIARLSCSENVGSVRAEIITRKCSESFPRLLDFPAVLSRLKTCCGKVPSVLLLLGRVTAGKGNLNCQRRRGLKLYTVLPSCLSNRAASFRSGLPKRREQNIYLQVGRSRRRQPGGGKKKARAGVGEEGQKQRDWNRVEKQRERLAQARNQ